MKKILFLAATLLMFCSCVDLDSNYKLICNGNVSKIEGNNVTIDTLSYYIDGEVKDFLTGDTISLNQSNPFAYIYEYDGEYLISRANIDKTKSIEKICDSWQYLCFWIFLLILGVLLFWGGYKNSRSDKIAMSIVLCLCFLTYFLPIPFIKWYHEPILVSEGILEKVHKSNIVVVNTKDSLNFQRINIQIDDTMDKIKSYVSNEKGLKTKSSIQMKPGEYVYVYNVDDDRWLCSEKIGKKEIEACRNNSSYLFCYYVFGIIISVGLTPLFVFGFRKK